MKLLPCATTATAAVLCAGVATGAPASRRQSGPPGYGWSLDAFSNFLPIPNGAPAESCRTCQIYAILLHIGIWTDSPALIVELFALGPITNGSQTLGVASKLQVNINGTSPLLSAAAKRYQAIMFAWGTAAPRSNAAQTLVALNIEVDCTDESAPQLGFDESYSLKVPAVPGGTSILKARSVWGALRGLETFSQLVEYEPETDEYILRYAPWMVVDNGPRMKHRSLMIDTARHWLPVATIKRQIDALSYSKMNTLHWVRKISSRT
eukprot:SAG31_NODE_11877_length_989_cov_1.498876_1_plen_265_part_00